jgi:hypothetical protein
MRLLLESRRRAIGPADTSHGVYPAVFLRLCNHRLYGHTSVIQSAAESIITHARNSESVIKTMGNIAPSGATTYLRIQEGCWIKQPPHHITTQTQPCASGHFTLRLHITTITQHATAPAGSEPHLRNQAAQQSKQLGKGRPNPTPNQPFPTGEEGAGADEGFNLRPIPQLGRLLCMNEPSEGKTHARRFGLSCCRRILSLLAWVGRYVYHVCAVISS